MPRRKKKKRSRTQDAEDIADPEARAPKSLVFRRGKCHHTILSLVENLRKVMEPNTAVKLKESKKNQLKDFVSVAGPLGVSHLVALSQTAMGTNLRLLRLPRGPTLTFRVENYTLMRDVVAHQKRPYTLTTEAIHPPLVVLNNFSGAGTHKSIMAAMFQNMFPAINVRTLQLNQCRRVVLYHWHAEEEVVLMRHYAITASPVGLNKGIKRVVKARLPDLSRYRDISDLVLGTDALSDSEVEDAPESKVLLPQNFAGRGNSSAQQSAVRLKELGPRLTLKLLKIEEDVGAGRVLYHSLVHKTPGEERALQKAKKKAETLKANRRAQQEANVRRKQQQGQQGLDVVYEDPDSDGDSDSDSDSDSERGSSADDSEALSDSPAPIALGKRKRPRRSNGRKGRTPMSV